MSKKPRSLKQYFITGLLVWLPMGITVWVLTWLLLLLTPAGEVFPAQLAGVLASLAGMLIGSLGPQAIRNQHGSHHKLAGVH